LIKEIIALEKIAKRSEEAAYYSLHFDLNQTGELSFDGTFIHSIQEQTDYLYAQSG